MNYGIVIKSIATLWDAPSETKCVEDRIYSTVSDEALHGMGLAVTGALTDGFYPVCTHYGYPGYVKAEDIRILELSSLQDWETSNLMVMNGLCVDVTSLPSVEGVRLITLYRGALLQVLEFDCAEKAGWAKVVLADGRTGYLRNQFLSQKRYSQAGLWEEELPQNFLEQYQKADAGKRAELEEGFREAAARTAKTYLGVQYRWGGKSTAGLDCSGLTSSVYMQNGVLTYRDAKIVEGYPVHEIPMEQIKKGDLLYFPGHIALYLGEGRYIHSTGKIGSGGVVVNSLNPQAEDYREDLVNCLLAVGSIF